MPTSQDAPIAYPLIRSPYGDSALCYPLPAMERLPLFPLNTVLFPGVPLPLHVFEERYRLMIGRCVDEQGLFGVVLIREGVEVGGDAEPHDIGTTARITHVQRLPDGRMNLITVGRRRFRVVALDRSEPYLQGDVEYVASVEVDAPDVAPVAERVAALYGEQKRLSMALSGQWTRTVGLPRDPDALADAVAAGLDQPAATKQELLAELSLPRRLKREVDLLGERIRALTERWEEQRARRYSGATLN